jgi:hypothetical protein
MVMTASSRQVTPVVEEEGDGVQTQSLSPIPITIPLDLSEQARKIFSNQQLSSDNYYALLLGILMPSDLLYTYFFRYNRLLDVDLPNAQDAGISGTQGSYIDYTAQHPALAAAVTLVFVSIAAAFIYSTYLGQKKTKNNNSYKYIYDTFKAEAEKAHMVNADDQLEESALAAIINNYLEKILEEDKDLKNKYAKVFLDQHTLNITLRDRQQEESDAQKNKPKPQSLGRKFINKVLSPAWETLSISSFTYWILWIGGSLFTGLLDSPGIAGIPNIVAFGLPLLSGLLYPAIKIYNYYNNKRLDAKMAEKSPAEASVELKKTISADACELLRRALLRCEFELKKTNIESKIKKLDSNAAINKPTLVANDRAVKAVPVIDNRIFNLTKSMKRKVAVTLFASATGMLVAAQYASWIATDFLDVLFNISISIPVANIAFGVLFFAGVGAFGLYNAYNRYNKVKEYQKDERITALAKNTQENVVALEKTLESYHHKIQAHERKLGRTPKPVAHTYLEEQFFTNVNRRGPDNSTFARKAAARAFQFINGVCTGVFLGRIFLVKGNALVLPFAAAMFSTPVTIGLLVGIGVLYGAFKMYEYHKDRQEKRAALLLNQRAERIVCLEREVQLACLREQEVGLEVIAAAKAKKAEADVIGAVVREAVVGAAAKITNATDDTASVADLELTSAFAAVAVAPSAVVTPAAKPHTPVMPSQMNGVGSHGNGMVPRPITNGVGTGHVYTNGNGHHTPNDRHRFSFSRAEVSPTAAYHHEEKADELVVRTSPQTVAVM